MTAENSLMVIDVVKVARLTKDLFFFFQFDSMSQTVCHRVVRIEKVGPKDGWGFMTKGDANQHDDRWLMTSRDKWIEPDRIRGKVRLRIPRLGLPILYIKETMMGKVN